ncbi:acyltransferase family protein [Phreatobacter aquaticus]|nr:acyltransferase [Phreatobacter aquaticus]
MKQTVTLPTRFRSLDAWRGICAALVVLFHVPILHMAKDAPAFANLQLGVDFFFVLSGFVISHAYGDRLQATRDSRGFMEARFRRLWPLHVVVLAAFVLLELAKLAYGYVKPGFVVDAAPFPPGRSPIEIVTNLLFLQSFGLHPGLSWNSPAWSIAVEFWTSAVFLGILLWAPKARNGIFIALAVASAAILALVSPSSLFVSSDWGFVRCLLGFSVGCLVYDLRLRLPAPTLPLGLLEILTAMLAAAFVLLTPQGPAHLAAPLVFGVLIYVYSFEGGAASALLMTRVPQALGRWSFAIYMTHAFLFQLMRTAGSFADQKLGLHNVVMHNGDKLITIGSPTQAIVALVAVPAVVIAVGAFFHRFVEVPFSRKPAPSAAATPTPRLVPREGGVGGVTVRRA